VGLLKKLRVAIDLITGAPATKDETTGDKSIGGGGYLGYYGLREWYDSQPSDIQHYLYKICGYGINTDSRNLTEGTYLKIHSADPEYPWTATKFLCNHAVTALHERNHDAYIAFLNEARNRVSTAADRDYYVAIKTRITRELRIYPDQKVINAIKPSIVEKIKNNPGILQVDLRKSYPSEDEYIFGLAFSQTLKTGQIRREKAGRTFRLFVD